MKPIIEFLFIESFLSFCTLFLRVCKYIQNNPKWAKNVPPIHPAINKLFA
jgi:hypothetical protein